MNFWKKTQGAVSVFLVIILVPCLFISALFVDMGRLYLSQGMAYSSADLALNSVLTKYDADLNEYYGLIASCQDMDEFYEVSEEFFLRTISSQNLEEDEIKLLTDTFETTVKSIIASETGGVQDMLKVESAEDVKIEPISNANLSKSVMLKEQVVEFMKYRGPITMATSIIGIFQNADGTNKAGVDALMNAETDEPIVEAKQEFHDSESEFLREAYNTYSYLYNNYSKNPIENSVLQEKIDGLGNALSTYRAIHSTTVANFYNTQNVCVFNRPVVAIDKYDSTYKEADVCSSSAVVDGTTTYYITWTDLNKIKADLNTKATKFEEAIKNFHSSVSGISYTKDTNDIQYWAKVDSIIYGRNGGTNYVQNVADKGEAMIKAYAKLNAALKCTPDGTDFPSDYTTQCNTELTNAKGLQEKYLVKGISISGDKYLTLVNNIERISAAEIYNVDPNSKQIDGQNINSLLSGIADQLNTTKAYCQSYIDILDKVINGGKVKRGNKTVKLLPLSDLIDLAEAYEESFNAYEAEVSSAPETDLQREMSADIEKYKASEYDEVNKESVEEMKTRLSNIKKQFQSVIDAIDSMKYGGKPLTEIRDYSTFKSLADTQVNPSDIGITKSSVNSEANSSWNALIVPNLSSGEKIVTLMQSSDYDLFLTPKINKVDVPALYTFFWEAFDGEPDDAQVDEQEKEMGKAEEAAEKNNTKDVSKDLLNEDAKKIVSDISKGYKSSFGFVSGLGALVELITDLTSGEFDDIRDNAYICAYILEMFSYATYENEGLYSLYESKFGETAVNALDGSNVKTEYAKVNTEEDGGWKSESTVDSYNKSLTNKMINATNNAAYLCELEYILYGKDTNAKNINAACTDIFAIRLLLNTISGFANFWSGTDATSATISTVGVAVSGLSCGVIPVAAVKAVLVMVLVACETCNDMSRLACGFPVELYKQKDKDWQCALNIPLGEGSSISDVIDAFTGENVVNTGEGFTYGDYIKLFVCLAVFGSDDDAGISETVMLRAGDLIQTNMRHVTGNNGFKLSNAKTHFKLTGKLSVDPILVDIPFFDEYNGPLKKITNWTEYEVNAIRGY